MSFFEVEIDDPREIRNVSETVLEAAEELPADEEMYVGLVHNHYSVVRGRNEGSRDLDSLINFDFDHPVEIFREDGGDSWVHRPDGRCYEKVSRIQPGESKSHERLMAQWGREIEKEVENFLQQQEEDRDIVPVYDSGDVYDANTGRQIGGLSMEIHGDRMLSRLCFYEDNYSGNHQPFHQLIEADMDTANQELEDPRNNYLALSGFYDYLSGESPQELEIEGELELGEQVENPRSAEYCISRQPS